MQINLIQDRKIDLHRNPKYTNRYTIAKLFPDDNPIDAMKNELLTLKRTNYIKTQKDIKFPNKSELRVFSKKYDDDVFIKFKLDVLSITHENICILSFHYVTRKVNNTDFPYKN